MVGNTDNAISRTCAAFGVNIREYMVAPIFFTDHGKGGHEWVIEFSDRPPDDLEKFAEFLDQQLQNVNSDYEAKRFGSLAMQRLQLNAVPPNTFAKWMRKRDRVGAQVKVPRLASHRKFVEEIMGMVQNHAPV